MKNRPTYQGKLYGKTAGKIDCVTMSKTPITQDEPVCGENYQMPEPWLVTVLPVPLRVEALTAAVDRFEKEHLLMMCSLHDDPTHAAASLRISVSTLYRKLKKHSLTGKQFWKQDELD